LNLAWVNTAVNDRVVVPNYVIINDLAIVVNMGRLISDHTEICAVLDGEITRGRPAIVCGAVTETETYPNPAACPGQPHARTPAASGR
jgi:hypothetical protein